MQQAVLPPQVAPSEAQGTAHRPASQARPAQQGCDELQDEPTGLQVGAHTPSRQRLPSQQSASAAHRRP